MKKTIIIITVMIFIAVITKSAYAQTPSSILSISPVIFNISLSPGRKYTHTLKITNNLDVPLPLTLTIEPLDTPDDGINQKSNNTIASWITFPVTDMIIEAKKERTVDFQIQVPDRVPLGGYYGMIFLHPSLPHMQGFPQEVSTKIGILLMGSIGVQDVPLNKVEINKFGFDSFVYEKNNIEINFMVKNASLNHFSAKPHLTIKPLFGSPQNVDLEEKFVFPGKSRKWSQTMTLAQFPHLFYKATLNVSVGGGIQKAMVTYFIAFPFFKLILILLVVIMSIGIFKKWGRFKKAVSILLKG